MTELDYANFNPGCLSYSEEMADVRDYKASDSISLDTSIKLPKSFSLGERVYETNYQGSYGSCTANSTCHCVQVLAVKKNGIKPVDRNIKTPSWKQLRSDMGHDLNNTSDSGDYIETAVKTAYKNGLTDEEGGESKFDNYCFEQFNYDTASITKMKRYLYAGFPIEWCFKGNANSTLECSKGEIKTLSTVSNYKWGHAVSLVGRDESGFRFLNSWSKNNDTKTKSRFHVPYSILTGNRFMFNRRYIILFNNEDAKTDPVYLKQKSNALLLLKALREVYITESGEIQKEICDLSEAFRKKYPELNDEFPIE